MSRWNIAAVVFDFDGVLVDSNRIKYDAFFEVMGHEHSRPTSAVLRRARELPRREIFASILKDIGVAGGELERAIETSARRYSTLVSTAIAAGGLIPGAMSVLRELSRSYSIHVSSTTPQQELRQLLKRLGVLPLLKTSHGWPRTKTETLRRLSAGSTPPRRIVVVGDGKSDRRAAAAVGCRFIGVANEFNHWVPGARNTISRISELPALLREHHAAR